MKTISKVGIFLCLILIAFGYYSSDVSAMQKMTLNTKVQSTTNVKLSWKKQKNVDGYKIYKEIEKNGNTQLVLIANLEKNKTSFVDKNVKPNTSYSYEISAYRRKKGKEIEKFWGCESVTTDLSKPINYAKEYDDDLEGMYGFIKTSTKHITIPLGVYEKGAAIGVDVCGSTSLKPDGIEVFKKVGKKYVSYKKIKIKKKKVYNFTDKKVKKGKKYHYKFRTYKKINGKMIYSKKTKSFTACAMNNNPSFGVDIVKSFDPTEQTITVSVTNHEDYGNLTQFSQWEYEYDDTVNNYMAVFDAVSYSYDNAIWNNDVKACKVKPGQTVYIKLKAQKDNFYKEASNITFCNESISFCVKHKFYHYWCNKDFKKNTIEIIHE